MATYLLKGLRSFFEIPAIQKKPENKLKYWEHLKLPQSLHFKKPENNYYGLFPLDVLLQNTQFKLHIKGKKSALNLLLFLKNLSALLKPVLPCTIEIRNRKLEISNIFTPLITKLKPTKDGKDHV